ncbi:DNA polymerase III subunit delta [Thalassotalea marina]|uniref:DNA polymerase III subunit delta n=1 Tax=Thalassotalea marina TaxID=1673741 RepID=A0A919BDG4_9GAMM|nr:DNA polymerase III subunit delta [Thalassotalea marina]GHF81314.1 DNA polymerase III subunit delta [Thalassotalea marina]
MRIYHNQLSNTLNKSLAPVWMIFGDEPWQKLNSLQQIKQHYLQQGFDEVIQLTVDDKFDWSLVAQEYQALSLFASRRIIELDLMTLKLNETAAKILVDLMASPSPDVLLLLHGDKIDAATQKRKWFKALDKDGVFLPLYDIEGKHLQQWIQKQARQYQVNMLPDVVFLLAELFEGNLNALDQELQKFAILFGQQLITAEQAQQLLIKQAKFNPFQIIDALLLGDITKCINMLDQLQHDGTPFQQLVWFIHKEIKQLADMQEKMQSGQDFTNLCKEYRIWDKRKPMYQKALSNISPSNLAIAQARLADTDLISKTSSDFNPFILLSDTIITLYHGQLTQQFALDYEFNH